MTLGFYFNMKRCTGCRACQVACQDRNDLAVGLAARKVESYVAGTYPNAMPYHFSAGCNHCENPACVANCPTGACQKAEDGTVFRDEEVCIGCGSCANSCPYGHPMIDDEAKKAIRCDSCRIFRENGQNPVCVDACQYRALDFGDLDELRAKYTDQELVNELPILPSAAETSPSLLVNPKDAALNDDFKMWIM
ncbi:DMSO reductase iron-sulfur subunit [Slackia heliotrinireducens]|uniref:Fe-S-cluster-containing hydrogenase subunit n=1 Tax=Slackia heliotrinireducens (strain ATCC 29202 / DSM 20476 / NCTC 11029 / RHS 1) TaxID=471855 RepID=C7N4F5_SLAHD|nr:4Fe-4S dicluster domain-containing protein [Slackia heliotrinireducens]ACV21790.1 Fe-S-cluster-containing hydrogenase subunit [Slackia heliotrinireducens DSM 20476]VEG99477.1 DMSO reductase iron-sulfur subunit [Slackia heliotrinireducens]